MIFFFLKGRKNEKEKISSLDSLREGGREEGTNKKELFGESREGFASLSFVQKYAKLKKIKIKLQFRLKYFSNYSLMSAMGMAGFDTGRSRRRERLHLD